eukprot:6195712-Pleurochrysis_carterae.AAC.1
MACAREEGHVPAREGYHKTVCAGTQVRGHKLRVSKGKRPSEKDSAQDCIEVKRKWVGNGWEMGA